METVFTQSCDNTLIGYASLSESLQGMADIGMYREFPLPGAVGTGIQPWMRPECNVVWEVCHPII